MDKEKRPKARGMNPFPRDTLCRTGSVRGVARTGGFHSLWHGPRSPAALSLPA